MNGTQADTFMKTLLSGEPLSPQDWRDYFCAFHAKPENAGRKQMRNLRDSAGLTTAGHLAGVLPAHAACILDVGSGEGALVPVLRERLPGAAYTGVDICGAETARAAAVFGDSQARFVTADAAELPFDDASFDCAVSHFALMLVEPVETAMQELHRVLRPGSTAAILMENRTLVQKERFTSIAASYLRRTFPAMAPPVTNPQARSAGAVAERLEAAGFTAVCVRELTFTAQLSPADLADLVMAFYIYGSLDAPHADELRGLLLHAARAACDAAGHARFGMPALLFTATA